MKRERFTTKFFINHLRVNCGEAIVQCRVSFRGKTKTFSTGLKIPAKNWDAKAERIIKTDTYSKTCNDNLAQVKAHLYEARDYLIQQRAYFSVDDMIDYTRGSDHTVRFLIQTYSDYINEYKRPMVESGKLSIALLQKHERTLRAMQDFLQKKHNRSELI